VGKNYVLLGMEFLPRSRGLGAGIAYRVLNIKDLWLCGAVEMFGPGIAE
jgi:hypothetical protein